MYCKNCGGDGHGAGECKKPPRANIPSPEVLREATEFVEGVAKAMFSKPVTKVVTPGAASVTAQVTGGKPAGKHCPTCRCQKLTNAEKQKAYRARKGKA